MTYQAVQAGAMGYLLKDAAADACETIRTGACGQQFFRRRRFPNVLAERFAAKQSDPREVVVLKSHCPGMSNKEIGTAQHRWEATVKAHHQHPGRKCTLPIAPAVTMAIKHRTHPGRVAVPTNKRLRPKS